MLSDETLQQVIHLLSQGSGREVLAA